MHPFLSSLALRLYQHPLPLHKHLVVLPTRRAAFHLKRIFAEGVTPDVPACQGWLPQFSTLNDWLADVSGLANADRLQLKFSCYEAYKEVLGAGAQDLSSFFAWADALIDDFNDIESQGINPDVIFRELKDYNEIAQFSFLDEPLSDRQQRYRLFWSKLKDIHKLFNAKILEQGEAYPGLMARLAVERWTAYAAAHPGLHITFAGFNALSSSEAELLTLVQEAGMGSIYFDTDPAWLDDYNNHAGMFIRRHLKKGLGTALVSPVPMAQRDIDFTWTEAPNKAAQADAIAALLHTLDADALAQTALVLADEAMLIPVLNRLPPSVREANITMGISLGQSALADWFDKLFALHERILRDSSGLFLLSDRLQALLRHPFTGILGSPFGEIPTADMRSLYTGLHGFRQKLQGSGWQLMLPVLNDWQHSAAPAVKDLLQFVLEVTAALGRVQDSGLELRMAGDGIAVLTALFRRLDKLPQMEQLGLVALHALVQDALRGARINLIGEPANGLQIMGLLEARALGYPRVLLCDVNEDTLPGKGHIESFIPFEIRAWYKMPGRREKEAAYANHFYRLLQNASHFHAVYHMDTSGPWGAEPSRYLRQVSEYLVRELPLLNVAHLAMPEAAHARPLPVPTLQKGPEVLAHIHQYLSRRVSPSGLNRYFESSLEWYYESVLKLAVPDQEGQLDVATFGTLVHAALESLYKLFVPGHIFTAGDLRSMESRADGILHGHFAESERIAQHDKGLNRLHFETARQMVLSYLKSELKSIEAGDVVELVATESRLSRSLARSDAHGAWEAQFVGVADLVLKRNGALRLVDFKTGRVQGSDLSVKEFDMEAFSKKPKALQLTLYNWMARPLYPTMKLETQIITLPNPRNRQLLMPISINTVEDEAAFESLLHGLIDEMLDAGQALTGSPDFKYAQFEPVHGLAMEEGEPLP